MAEVSLTTPPAAEPVTLDEAKLLLRIDQSDEDALVSSLITAAREQVEADTGRLLITQTWTWILDQLPRYATLANDGYAPTEDDESERWMIRWARGDINSAKLRAPIRPLQAVTSLTYRQGGTDVDYDVGTLRTTPEGSIIFPVGNLPLADEAYAAMTLKLEVGYGPDAGDVPGWAIQAIRFLIAHWYENRIPVMTGRSGMALELPDTYEKVIGPRRVWSL